MLIQAYSLASLLTIALFCPPSEHGDGADVEETVSADISSDIFARLLEKRKGRGDRVC